MKKTNIEIEFKTAICKDTYDKMLNLFDLENNIFKQTNYYFDTDDLILNRNHIVLRIRQKGDIYKVTLKKQNVKGAFESHVMLQKEDAENMIKNGFHTKDFFDDIDYFVTFKASLDNYRVSTPYEDGVLFFDRCDYNSIVEYEIEYEVSDYDDGKKEFMNFLKKHNIEYKQTKRKSERALNIK